MMDFTIRGGGGTAELYNTTESESFTDLEHSWIHNANCIDT